MKYSDALSSSRALLTMLRLDLVVNEVEADDDGRRLLDQTTVGFWSEHSERGTMDTWMQLAGVPPEARKMVGRWSASTEEGYLRNLETNVRLAQTKVATTLRDSDDIKSFVDFDMQVTAELGEFLKERKVPAERVATQRERLELESERTGPLGGRGNRPVGAPSSVPSPSTPRWSDQPDEEETFDGSKKAEVAMEVPLGSFVFSVRGRCHRRTLHRTGECWRKPGIHYRDFLVAGQDRPPLEAGDRECKECFQRNASCLPAVPEEVELSSSSSSEEDPEPSTGVE